MNKYLMNFQQKFVSFIIPLILFLICINTSRAQSNSVADQQITKVFNDIVNAYGNAKIAPTLKIIPEMSTPAFYRVDPSPLIEVDRRIYNLGEKFGKDKLNAVSIIIAHELAHYYNDDTFCTDFAFAIRHKNENLKDILKQISKGEKIKLETKADRDGLYYAKIAGYEPFDIYPELLDEIYKRYKIDDFVMGYPSKGQRKDINLQVQKNVIDLYRIFKQGISAYEHGDYNKAINKFEEINKIFPSRENYNNLGVSKTMKVLQNKLITREESKYPNRFKYPLSIDTASRLAKPSTYRNSLSDSKIEEVNSLLKSAQRDFEKAISLDPDYTQSYINLACVFDLLGNHYAAIGKINEINREQQKSKSAQRILAIAYYNAGMIDEAQKIWGNMKIENY